MSLSRTAILHRSEVPTQATLQEALQALRFKLSVDVSYEPFVDSGYLACTLNGEDGGFTIRFQTLAEYSQEFPELTHTAGTRDTAIRLRSGGDPREAVCVLMVAAALAQHAKALIHAPESKELLAAERLISQACSRFAELD